mmetsp:Transcript_3317/g.4795  ORF Transcript_3317/g.4795 Transcript_3317/m.4795 type:complete len:1045 (+) Transcript_3317:874-4008(+)|eukprot:CAMPEP_0203792710 /NCGR_PEP_ID=MMETSP0100_2-20121128/5418_1 /ASSEMBLY_ACC=CAM_ASM_000210 /TAXON_ID=96639 /ORGANISM=" , Strain NY0313808BC1" /LENGTH=1044 /DNA_ID=CAMNT_0050696323 /DNA_START=841 /DNA_END=3975 /DNA_ORIENTATION=+
MLPATRSLRALGARLPTHEPRAVYLGRPGVLSVGPAHQLPRVSSRLFSSWWWDKDKPKPVKDDTKTKGGKAEKPEQVGPEEVKVEANKPEAAKETPATKVGSNNGHNSITPVLELQGAPRQPNVLALPLERRPLFPGLMHPIQITDRHVYETLVRARAAGNTYIGLFLRKPNNNNVPSEGLVNSDVITDLSEIYNVGTFCQILQVETIPNILTDSAKGASNDTGFQDQEVQQEKQQLRKQLFDDKELSLDGQTGGDDAKMESWTLIVKAHRRIQIEEMVEKGPPPLVKVRHITEFPLHTFDTDMIRAYTNEVLATLRDVIRHNPLLREHMQFFSARFDMSDPHHVCNFAAALTSADGPDLQEVLEALNLEQRLKKVLTLLKKEVQLNQLQEEISKQVEETISANQRKYFLNEQLKQIKKELGLEHDDKDALLGKFQEKLDRLQGVIPEEEKESDKSEEDVDADTSQHETFVDVDGIEKQRKKKRTTIQGVLPSDAKKVIEDEMKKLSTLEKTSPEFNVTRAYLDWLLSLPWGKCTVENLDVKVAKGILEADHFGLSDIKERILEFIAVGNLRGTVRGKIILLVGPPGVGKTSIGKSIAHALDREFYRFSVGGLSDVSEIKGHRRTYIGAMPGKAIQCLKTTGVSNPVVLIDEIDKLGSGYRGDPASALLELLDPAQNSSFLDHYLDVPVDLSKVLFVCTANSTDTIPGPLLDRMEVLRLSGYDLPEKVEIAKRYLEPRAREESGLVFNEDKSEEKGLVVPESLSLDEDAVSTLARWYCREAGVRNLQQHIERIYRKVALELLLEDPEERAKKDWGITKDKLEHYVGKRKFTSDKLYESVPPPGVVMGLAWSTTGGSSLYIETTCIKRSTPHEEQAQTVEGGKQQQPPPMLGFTVHTTGQLGDVMKESTSLALTYARHKLQELDPGNAFFEKNQIHLHVPEGATPKDGPSAGVSMTTALLSLAMNESVIPDLAMTGEISLTGMVLPIGGVKEKIIAARRSGVTTVIVPDGNRSDVDKLADYLKEGISIHFAKSFDDVFKVAFNKT